MAKIKTILIALFAILTLNLSAQNIKKISSDIPAVTTLIVDGDIVVNIVSTSTNHLSAKVLASDSINFTWNIIDGSTLVLKRKVQVVNKATRNDSVVPQVSLSITNLENIKCKRGALLISDKVIESKVVSLEASRSSSIGLVVKCQDLSIESMYNSSIRVNGTSDYLVANGSNSSKIDCRALTTESSTVDATTDSDCWVNATKKLLLTAKTNATIHYKKSDAVLSKYTSLMGKVLEFE